MKLNYAISLLRLAILHVLPLQCLKLEVYVLCNRTWNKYYIESTNRLQIAGAMIIILFVPKKQKYSFSKLEPTNCFYMHEIFINIQILFNFLFKLQFPIVSDPCRE